MVSKKYFFDTEFIEYTTKGFLGFGRRRRVVDLISIGIVSGDGREYYAISNEFDPDKANDWVWDNVLIPMVKAELGDAVGDMTLFDKEDYVRKLQEKKGKSLEVIAQEIESFIFPTINDQPQSEEQRQAQNIAFYAYVGAYDWALFCHIFDGLTNIPQGIPKYFHELKVLLKNIGNPDIKGLKDQNQNVHNALADAQWNRMLFEWIGQQKKSKKKRKTSEEE